MHPPSSENLIPTFVAFVLFGLVTAIAPTANADRPASTVPELGVRDRIPDLRAFVNATIVPQAGVTIENGRLVIDGGVIIALGTDIMVPGHAHILDMSGKTIYPGLIEPYSEVDTQQEQSKAAHWNKYVRPERDPANNWDGSESNIQLREAGFVLRLLVPHDGILKGTSAIVTTRADSPGDSVVARKVAHHLRLTSPLGANRETYPSSPMGAVALARQTFYDADWYARAWRAFRSGDDVQRPESNVSLEFLATAVANDDLFVFEAPDEQYVLRANAFAVEFGLRRVAIRGSGREYQRIDAVAATGRPMIIPVNFPKPPNVSTVEVALDATLSELMHWRFAPENPARLQKHNIAFSLTSHGLDDKQDFRKQLRQAVKRGLSADAALNACTLEPARLLGIENKAGSIAIGKAAHFMITDGDWLNEKTEILETWVDGRRYRHRESSTDKIDGVWKLEIDTKDAARKTLFLIFREKDHKLSGKASLVAPIVDHDDGTEKAEEKATGKGNDDQPKDGQKASTQLLKPVASFGRVTTSFSSEIWGATGTVRLTGTLLHERQPILLGELLLEDGKRISYKATRQDEVEVGAEDEEVTERENEDTNKPSSSLPAKLDVALNFPLGNYGVPDPIRTSETVLIENAIVWTCGSQGVLENVSVLIQDGKIAAVGTELEIPKDTKRIDAKGKHVSPGIIDCHSHMATDGGINEGTQAITAEVRISDFIDATDIAIYQQLAGGVTTANVLHGSANPIGGQNQVIKLRWGRLPDELKFAEAPQGIKFALGENVKQSNAGDDFKTRYPQSRLGVEQIIRDAFIAAKQYEREWQEWRKNGKGMPPRKDIELDTIIEIVNGQRWIHCHSYRQDEILALMRTLESFDITIGTFQHILEGYKVAQEMAAHGAMGSAFSDWWAYKFEVYDAIPYNGTLMHNAGVVVSFNSDDRELARHLNHEAAKAVKYGGVPPEEALKFVTLNPAKQLRIDQYVGSIEVGKHADLVVWSGHPLQITSRCEQTWIDGIPYFDIGEDTARRNSQVKLRQQLVKQILDSGETMKKEGEREELWRNLFPRHDEYCGHGHDHGE